MILKQLESKHIICLNRRIEHSNLLHIICYVYYSKLIILKNFMLDIEYFIVYYSHTMNITFVMTATFWLTVIVWMVTR